MWLLRQADQRGVNPLCLPGSDHVVAEHIDAQRGGVGNLDVLVAAQPGQINGGIQGVATKALLHRAENLTAQLDHAFAKQHDWTERCHSSLRVYCFSRC